MVVKESRQPPLLQGLIEAASPGNSDTQPILEHSYSDIGLFGILDKAKEDLRHVLFFFVHSIISRLFHYFSFN